MTAGWTTSAVSFPCDGEQIAGVLYRPEGGAPPFPCVVFAHGFSGTMDWILPDFAAVFCAAGLAVLTFDYRGFGSSEGTPRQIVNSARQLEDIRAALDVVRNRADVDPGRIGLWGTSLGGSHVLQIAAEDPRVAAVVANVPALDMYTGLRGRHRSPDYRPGPAQIVVAVARLLSAAVVDEVRGRLGRSPRYLPVYGRLGRAFFADPALAQRFRAVEAQAPSWRNAVAPRFLLHAPRYRNGTIERVRCPVLVTLARDDAEVSTPFVERKVRRGRDVEIRKYPAGHFDMYHGAVRDEVARDQREFLIRHLQPDRAARKDR